LPLLALLPAAASPADAAPRRRPGRVVRIERPRHVDADPIHLCMVAGMEDGKLICYGQEPLLGSTLRLVSVGGVRGTGAVRSVAPSTMMETCHTGTAHDVVLEMTSTLPGASPAVYALQGVAMSNEARVMPDVQVTGLPLRGQERPFVVLDRDGDAAADMAITAGECPADAQLEPVAPERRVTAFCIDYWLDDGRGYARAARDIIYQCQ
jgi:hypothetical protein